MLAKHNKLLTWMIWMVAFLGLTQISYAKNLAVLDGNSIKQTHDNPTYTVVRTGKPSFGEFQKMCRLGVRRMIVLSGNGDLEQGYAREPWAQAHCKGFTVVYNRTQKAKTPLSKQFLTSFDSEIQKAKAGNYGVGFRCNCGCHRTGRLAAYFEMKYKKLSARDALDNLHDHMTGFAKLLHRRKLKKQVYALEDYIQGKNCGEKKKFCVTDVDSSGFGAQNDNDDPDFSVDTRDEELGVIAPEPVTPIVKNPIEVDELDDEDFVDGELPFIHGERYLHLRYDNSTYIAPRPEGVITAGRPARSELPVTRPVDGPRPTRSLLRAPANTLYSR